MTCFDYAYATAVCNLFPVVGWQIVGELTACVTDPHEMVLTVVVCLLMVLIAEHGTHCYFCR